MASISTDKKTGRRIVQFVGTDRKRRSVRLGKLSKKQAESVCTKIEAILAAKRANRPMDAETAEWIGGLTDDMHGKLVKAGLLIARESDDSQTVGEHLADYLQRRSNVKGGTRVFYGHTVRNLLDYFSADHKLRDITPGDADDFRRFLEKQGLAAATVSRRCSLARAIFRDAERHRLIAENPFEEIRLGSQSNPARHYFVTAETIQRVLDACPNAEWRLLVALSRFAGLRVPSEALTLRWEDIQSDRMFVRSPKTEHHAGKESRWVPIFPELRPYLEDVREVTPDGAVFVFDQLRRTAEESPTGWKAINLRTQFTRIVKLAGEKPWPRL